MKIGILLHPYGEKKPAGLGRAILDMTRALVKEAAHRNDEVLIFAKGSSPSVPDFLGTNWSFHALGTGVLWREHLARAPQADGYLFNTPVLPLLWRAKKSVVIALDFAYLEVTASGILGRVKIWCIKQYHAYSLSRASAVIAISASTKRDVIRLFGVPESKIRVVHLGFNRICAIREERMDTPERFFLFVGVMKERKNVLRIIRAFQHFSRTHPDWHLLLAGEAEGEYARMLKETARAGAASAQIRFLGYRTDAEIAYLYRHAAAFVYPSIIEGFGFPVLEAMDCGVPVITSRSSSLPEVAGDAAILVDPGSREEISRAMERIVSDPALGRDLILRGHEQVKNFSWEKTAREIMDIFYEI